MQVECTAVLAANRFDLDQRLAEIYVIENAEIPNSQFPFRQPIRTQSFAVTRWLSGLMLELPLDTTNDLRRGIDLLRSSSPATPGSGPGWLCGL